MSDRQESASSKPTDIVDNQQHDDLINKWHLNTQLLDAIVNCDNEEVRSLLEKGASPNATCLRYNLTACHAAAVSNQDALCLLLSPEYNAVKDRRDKEGRTPLHWAAWLGKNRSIAILLDLPQELQDNENLRITPDIMESILPKESAEIDVLCKCESNAMEVEESWRCGTQHSCEKFVVNAVMFSLVWFLRNASEGWTPLHFASSAVHHNSTRLLLAAGANINAKDKSGETPLEIAGKDCIVPTRQSDTEEPFWSHMINAFGYGDASDKKKKCEELNNVESNYVETINSLLQFRKKNKTVETSSNDLGSALVRAVQLHAVEAVEILVTAGASITHRNLLGTTPLHACMKACDNNILELFTQQKTLGKSINVTDADGYNVLQSAVIASWLPGVEMSFNDISDITHKANDGKTAIHLAACDAQILDYLFSKFEIGSTSAIVNLPDNKGDTPLIAAINKRNLTCVKNMIEKGGDLSLRNEAGETAISLFMSLDEPVELLEALLDDGIEFLYEVPIDHDSPFLNLLLHISIKSKVLYKFGVLAPKINEEHDKEQMRVLKAFVETGNSKGQRKLLQHPLVERFLYIKWQNYSIYFWMIISLYCLFALSLSAVIVSSFYYYDRNKRVPNFWNPIIWFSIMLIALVIIFAQEFSLSLLLNINWTLLIPKIKKCPRLENLIESGIKYGSFVLAIATALVINTGSLDTEWYRYLAALTLVLAWSNIMLLLSKTPVAGFYIQMFWNVALKIIKILLIFSSLIIMFSFCFMVQFHGQAPFDGPVAAIIKTLVMMTSEFEYENNFSVNKINVTNSSNENTDENNLSRKIPNDYVLFSVDMLRFVFVVFMILTSIVLMNLMTGIAVSDVQDLVRKGTLRRVAKQIELLCEFEAFYNRKKSWISILRLKKWLIREDEETNLSTVTCNYDDICRENIQVLRNKSLVKLKNLRGKFNGSKSKDDLHDAIENEQNIVKNESKIDEDIPFIEAMISRYESNFEDVIQATIENKQNIVRIESKLEDILQAVKAMKSNSKARKKNQNWVSSYKLFRKRNQTL